MKESFGIEASAMHKGPIYLELKFNFFYWKNGS